MMISKNTFVSTMNKLEELDKKMDNVNNALRDLSPDFCGFYITQPFDIVVGLLKDIFNDEENGNIEYCLYDLDFLRDYVEGCVTEEDGTPVDLSSWDKVYDFLIANIPSEDKED